MQSCSSAVVVLLLLTTNASPSAVPTVKVEYNGTAVLPCSENCSGVVRWTVFNKPKDPLAECNQTCCRSVKEGYQMIYNQYLQMNLSLIITEAEFSKRGTYTCDCDGKDLCDAELQIEPLKTTVQIKPGESLLLDLSDPVEVIYSSTEAARHSSVKICSVYGYALRTEHPLPALDLRRTKVPDSEVYTIRDTINNEDICTVTVREDDSYPGGDKGAVVPWRVMILLAVLLAVLLVVCAALVMVIMRQKKENVRLQKFRVRKAAEIKYQTRPILKNTKRGPFFS